MGRNSEDLIESYCEYSGRCEYKHKRKIQSKDVFVVICIFKGKCSQQTFNLTRLEVERVD